MVRFLFCCSISIIRNYKEGLPMLVHPVESNEYEIASHIIKSLLQKGLISKAEFEKIDAENKRAFVGEKAEK